MKKILLSLFLLVSAITLNADTPGQWLTNCEIFDCETGGGGGGGISEVSGTDSEITVTNGSSSPVISLPDAIITPGSLQTTGNLLGAYHSVREISSCTDGIQSLELSDANGIVYYTNNSDCSIVTPFSGEGSVPLGYQVTLVNYGTGEITFANVGSDNTVASDGSDSISQQYAAGIYNLLVDGTYYVEVIRDFPSISVNGTANQITASTTDGVTTLSIASPFIAPGSVQTSGALTVNGIASFPTANYTTYNPYISSSNDGTNSFFLYRADSNVFNSAISTSINSGTSQINNTPLYQINDFSGTNTILSVDTGAQTLTFNGNIIVPGTGNNGTIYLPITDYDLYSPYIEASSVDGGFSQLAYLSDSHSFLIDNVSQGFFQIGTGASNYFTVSGDGVVTTPSIQDNGSNVSINRPINTPVNIDVANTSAFTVGGLNVDTEENLITSYVNLAVYGGLSVNTNSVSAFSVNNGFNIDTSNSLIENYYKTSVYGDLAADSSSSTAFSVGSVFNINGSNGEIISNNSALNDGLGQIGIGTYSPDYSLDIYNAGETPNANIHLMPTDDIPDEPVQGNDIVIYNYEMLLNTINYDGTLSEIVQANLREVLSDYTVDANDYIIAVNESGSVFTITLPYAYEVTPGREYCVKDQTGEAASYNIIVNTLDESNIDNSLTFVINEGYESQCFYANAYQWFTI
jgi:hypothetical protein